MSEFDLDELERKTRAMKGWENINTTQYNPYTDYTEVGALDEDGNWYALLRVNAEQYTDDQGDDVTVAEYYAAVNCGVVAELIRRLREAERDAARLDWFQENIVEHKPAGYDGRNVGRFDIVWDSETNYLRDAIDAAMSKVCAANHAGGHNAHVCETEIRALKEQK